MNELSYASMVIFAWCMVPHSIAYIDPTRMAPSIAAANLPTCRNLNVAETEGERLRLQQISARRLEIGGLADLSRANACGHKGYGEREREAEN